MGDKDKIELTVKFVPYDDLTRKLNLLERISRLAGNSRIFRASAVTVAMLALISCSASPPRAPLAPLTPLGQHNYTIPCQHADSLPKIANHGVWMCERYIDTCSCVPVSRQSIFGR